MNTENNQVEKVNDCPNIGCEGGKWWSPIDKQWVVCPFCNP